MKNLPFKPKQITKKLLSVLPARARDVIEKRYGLGPNGEPPMTLEAIGQTYGITRERVRQIENYAIEMIQKSDVYAEYAPLFAELQKEMDLLGGVIAEHDLLKEFGSDRAADNHLYFIFVLGIPFNRSKENSTFHHRWFTREDVASAVETALLELHDSLTDDSLLSGEEIVASILNKLDALDPAYKREEFAHRWLSLSKVLAQNPLGEWGLASSPNVRAKGIRDFAYLAVKRHGSPMHFKEVAESIEKLFARKAHVATCHNELIKDKRFVLVGRGLYALEEWGYSAGVVKDILHEILKANGPLPLQEIIERVRKERYVKDNTIMVNLQDRTFFKRLPNGQYAVIG
ncbi:hypothetical protein HY416_04465 [Candidatus Kaiserbacteria bacterium]|nr:hypothetical protein [Candidatus Kaiserbacteria bacterium]